jgi:hypothetical protein
MAYAFAAPNTFHMSHEYIGHIHPAFASPVETFLDVGFPKPVKFLNQVLLEGIPAHLHRAQGLNFALEQVEEPVVK